MMGIRCHQPDSRGIDVIGVRKRGDFWARFLMELRGGLRSESTYFRGKGGVQCLS